MHLGSVNPSWKTGKTSRLRHLTPIALTLVSAAMIFTVSSVFKRHESSTVSFDMKTAEDLRRERFAAEEAYARSPNAQTLNRLIVAAYASGEFEAVLRLTQEPNAPFADETARRVAEGEARLRLRQYDLAASAVSAKYADAHASPTLLFLKARAQYAAAPSSGETILNGIRAAVKTDTALAGEGWMFRTQIALDSNEFDTARAAANRAREAGVDVRRVEAAAIETAIRAGELTTAATLLSDRKKMTGDKLDYDGRRLAGMLAYSESRYKDAARELDLIATWLQMKPRGDLIRAAAKFDAGETAQATSIVASYVKTAPDDWVAADISWLLGDAVTLEDIRRLNPALAEARAFAQSRRRGDIDLALEALNAYVAAAQSFKERPPTGLEFLFGAAASDQSPMTPSAKDWRTLELARKVSVGGDADADLEVEAMAADPTDAIDQLVSARAFLSAGEIKRGLSVLNRAAFQAPQSMLLSEELASAETRFGSAAKAIMHRQKALDQNPDWISVRRELARSLEESGRLGAALRVLFDGAPQTLSDDHTAPMAARLAVRLRQSDKIQELKRRANGISSRDVRAATLYTLGETEEASRLYRQILIVDPGNSDAAAGYFAAMKQLGREAQARAFLNQIAISTPPAPLAINDPEA